MRVTRTAEQNGIWYNLARPWTPLFMIIVRERAWFIQILKVNWRYRTKLNLDNYNFRTSTLLSTITKLSPVVLQAPVWRVGELLSSTIVALISCLKVCEGIHIVNSNFLKIYEMNNILPACRNSIRPKLVKQK